MQIFCVSTKEWIHKCKEVDNSIEGTCRCKVGNKLDLTLANPKERKVGRTEAEKFAEENGFLFDEASAFSNTTSINIL